MAELTAYQRDKIIRTALGEARGEGVEGMADVIQVIMNRAASGDYPSDPAAVALQKNNKSGIHAFSTWNNERNGGNNPNQFRPTDSIYKDAERALDAVLSGQRPDYTGGATHYHTSAVNPYWAESVNRYGTVERNGHIFYPTLPTPPGEIPNVVASQTDTQRRPQQVMGSAQAPTSRASMFAPTREVTPRLAPGNDEIYSYHIPEITPASVAGGAGSLTPEFFNRNVPLPQPRPERTMEGGVAPGPRTASGFQYAPNGRPRDPDNGYLMATTDPRYVQAAANSPNQSVRNSVAGQAPNVPLPQPLPSRAVAGFPTPMPTYQPSPPRRLPELPPPAGAPDIVTASMARANAAADPALQRALERRIAQPGMIDASMQRVAAAEDPALRRALAMQGPSGVGLPPSTRAVASVPFPMPTTAVPGPRAVPKSQERLVAGAYPMAPAGMPELPRVGTALDVVPPSTFPPMPRPRPVPFAMPTMMGARPALPQPARPVFGMPTPLTQRPVPAPTMRVAVNGAGSYGGGRDNGGSAGNGAGPRGVLPDGRIVTQQERPHYNPDTNKFETRTVWR